MRSNKPGYAGREIHGIVRAVDIPQYQVTTYCPSIIAKLCHCGMGGYRCVYKVFRTDAGCDDKD